MNQKNPRFSAILCTMLKSKQAENEVIDQMKLRKKWQRNKLSNPNIILGFPMKNKSSQKSILLPEKC